MLSSPIILYDHPQIAPESDGELCDATEIDEILALRVLTLTDEEKAEARATDPRAAAIIDRIDDMAPEVWARLHGTHRASSARPRARSRRPTTTSAVPWWEPARRRRGRPVDRHRPRRTASRSAGDARAAAPVAPGRRARHVPRGMVATVAGVFHDVDGELHVAVTVDDDPATEALLAHGRYLYFHPDEIEPLVDVGARAR